MATTYPKFNVNLYNDADGSLTPQAGLTVKLYNFTTLTDLGISLTSAADGTIANGSISSGASNGDEIRFRVESDSHGRGGWTYCLGGAVSMLDLTIRPSRGFNLIFRPEALPPVMASPTVSAGSVQLYWRLSTEPTSAVKFIGTFAPTGKIVFPNYFSTDQDIYIHVNPVNGHGTPFYSHPGDAPATLFVQNRENNAATIGQFSVAATTTSVVLSVGGFSLQFARFRYVQSTDSTATKQVETITVSGTATATGTLIVTVKAAGMNLSPKAVTVNITNADTASAVATKVSAALNADPDVSRFFIAAQSSANVSITANFGTINDPTMNLSLALGTATGIAPVTTSTHTTAGAGGSSDTSQFIDITQGISSPAFQNEFIVATVGTQTRLFRVAHSSASLSGPWSPWSNVQSVTFAGTGGGTGSGGTGDPTSPDKQPGGLIT